MKSLGRTVALAVVLSSLPAYAENEAGIDENEMRLAVGIEGAVGAIHDDIAYGVGGAIGFRGPAGFTLRARAEAMNNSQLRTYFIAPELRVIVRDRVFLAAAPGISILDAKHGMSDIISDPRDSTGFGAQARIGAFVTSGPRRLAVSLAYEHMWVDYNDGNKLVTLALGFESL